MTIVSGALRASPPFTLFLFKGLMLGRHFVEDRVSDLGLMLLGGNAVGEGFQIIFALRLGRKIFRNVRHVM